MTPFIDVHCHAPLASFLEGPISPYRQDLGKFLGIDLEAVTPAELAEFYRSRGGRAVLMGWDSEAVTGAPPFGAKALSPLVAEYPDVFMAFGAVNPLGGSKAVADVHDASRMGMKGLAFHPAAQGTAPSDRTVQPIWEAAAEHGLICLIHTGFTRLGAGMPGGGGIRLDVARPIHVDRVAVNNPELKIILSHTGSMWFDEAVAIALHKPNVYLDVAGQQPSMWSPEVVALMQGPLGSQILFGSDHPFNPLDQLVETWSDTGFGGAFTEKLMVSNAAHLLGW